jgi:aryl-alcohol dehydrogenase-like predicted oxidoreductase
VPGCIEAALCLQELKEQGVVRQIGVTNFNPSMISKFIAAGVQVATCQLQYSLIDNRPEKKMLPLLKTHGIVPVFYGTLAGGWLSDYYLGISQMPDHAENRSLIKYGLVIKDRGGWEVFRVLLGVLKELANELGVSLSTVALRAMLDKEPNSCFIVGARSDAHLQDVVSAYSIKLSQSQSQRIIDAVSAFSELPGDVYDVERVKDGNHASIMRYNLNSNAVAS